MAAFTNRSKAAYHPLMYYFAIKALISGVIVAAVSEIARRYPGLGGMLASLPLISVLGMMWLWRDTRDIANLASHSTATFWFVLPSLPMFLIIPFLLNREWSFWASLAVGCTVTMALYTLVVWIGPRLGIPW